MRFDLYLVENGYFESRNKAAAAIKEGRFAVDEKIILKPSFDVSDDTNVTVLRNKKVYVARSAQKLLRAYEVFDPQWAGFTVADLGASTGGFCQVLLEKGVKKIYAVDIGTAQLHPTVKADQRVVNMEHTNARYLTSEVFDEPINAITADLSFISIKAVLPAIFRTLSVGGQAILLVKPQFEVGPKNLSKTGVVTDLKHQCKAVEEVAIFAQDIGFGVKGISFSGLAGESGNREYLLYIEKGATNMISISSAVHAAVYSEEKYE